VRCGRIRDRPSGCDNGVDAPKSDPIDIAHQTVAGVEAGAHEAIGDDLSHHVRDALSGELAGLYPTLS